jgi:hypothetical protein
LAPSENLVAVGWTGRNVAALEAHIKELEAPGVARPRSVPIFYRNAASLLRWRTRPGGPEKSSGEFVLFSV